MPPLTWFVTPSKIFDLLKVSNLRGLVKISAFWFWDFESYNYTSFFIMHLLIKWYDVSLCLLW